MSDEPSVDEMKEALAELMGRSEGLRITWRWHAPDRCYMLTHKEGSDSFGASASMDCQVVEMDGLAGPSDEALLKALETAHTALWVTSARGRLHNLWTEKKAAEAKLAALEGACRRVHTRGRSNWDTSVISDEFFEVVVPLLEAT